MSEIFIIFVFLLVVLVAAVIVRFSPIGVRAGALSGLTAWVGYATVLGSLGPRLLAAGAPPLPMLLALPAVGLVMFCTRSRFGERLAGAIPAYVLMGLQAFRIVVELTLHELSAIGLVPRMLTYEGANFDVVIGLSAPLAAWLLATKRLAPRGAIAWNLIGIVMVANVVVRSILTTPGPTHLIDTEIANQAVTLFPYTFIPGLLAPLAVVLHVLAIRGLRSTKSQFIINRQPPIGSVASQESP
jgi:hypothetical protein